MFSAMYRASCYRHLRHFFFRLQTEETLRVCYLLQWLRVDLKWNICFSILEINHGSLSNQIKKKICCWTVTESCKAIILKSEKGTQMVLRSTLLLSKRIGIGKVECHLLFSEGPWFCSFAIKDPHGDHLQTWTEFLDELD